MSSEKAVFLLLVGLAVLSQPLVGDGPDRDSVYVYAAEPVNASVEVGRRVPPRVVRAPAGDVSVRLVETRREPTHDSC